MLAHGGVSFESRDIFKRPLSADELRGLAGRASVAELFSWKSPTARQRGLTPGTLDDEAMIELMSGEPRLIRRPLVLAGDRLIIGADAKALASLAGSPPARRDA